MTRPASRTAAAIAGVALLALALGGCSIVDRAREIVEQASGGSDPYDEGSYPEGDTDVTDLAIGQCFEDPDYASYVDKVATVSCDGDHANQVFAVLPVANDYPGDAQADKQGRTGCIDAFEAFVGRPYIDSSLDYWYFTADRTHWTAGEPATVCYLFDWEYLPLTTTAQDSGL